MADTLSQLLNWVFSGDLQSTALVVGILSLVCCLIVLTAIRVVSFFFPQKQKPVLSDDQSIKARTEKPATDDESISKLTQMSPAEKRATDKTKLYAARLKTNILTHQKQDSSRCAEETYMPDHRQRKNKTQMKATTSTDFILSKNLENDGKEQINVKSGVSFNEIETQVGTIKTYKQIKQETCHAKDLQTLEHHSPPDIQNDDQTEKGSAMPQGTETQETSSQREHFFKVDTETVIRKFTKITGEGHVFCEICLQRGKPEFAVKMCLSCFGKLCEACTDSHSCASAISTKEDGIQDRIMEGNECEPCKIKGKIKECIKLCEECEETICRDCVEVHEALKATKLHKLAEIKIEPINCKDCMKINDKKPAEKRCDECNTDLCLTCTDIHTTDRSKSHNITEISNLQKRKLLTINSMKKSIKMKKEKMKEPKDINKKDQPGKPVASKVSFDSIMLDWDSPNRVSDGSTYQIRHREVSEEGNNLSKWKFFDKQPDECRATVTGLKSNTSYVFQVRMLEHEEEGTYSKQSDTIKTERSAATALFEFTEIAYMPDASIPVRRLLPERNRIIRNTKAKTRKIFFHGNRTPMKEKTIMLVGATGSGKSTLIDGMINYINGVSWDDRFRLTVIDLEKEEKAKSNNEALSQTEWVSCYTIPPMTGSRLDYTLNIVDTPGFGDTRGIDRDKEIVNQIRELFSEQGDQGIVFLDAVCFLTKAPDARLTSTQVYIFESILSLFGKDIEENICILVTFADGKRPPVLSALKEAGLPNDSYFTFNNSALFAENIIDDRSSMSAMFWEMGAESFCKFFRQLDKQNAKSLTQTKNVLQERRQIEITVENLGQSIDLGLHKIEELRMEKAIFERHESDIQQNEDFEYEVTETTMEMFKLPDGQNVTNCMFCHMTCHRYCAFADNEEKKYCAAIDGSGQCRECPNNCHWTQHKNTPCYYEPVQRTVKKTYQEKLKKYEEATSEILTHSQLLDKMTDELKELESTVLLFIDELNKCNNRLKEIALRPNPLDTEGYIDMMIQSEKIEKKIGFMARIESLERYKQRMKTPQEAARFLEESVKIVKNNDEGGLFVQAKKKLASVFSRKK